MLYEVCALFSSLRTIVSDSCGVKGKLCWWNWRIDYWEFIVSGKLCGFSSRVDCQRSSCAFSDVYMLWNSFFDYSISMRSNTYLSHHDCIQTSFYF